MDRVIPETVASEVREIAVSYADGLQRVSTILVKFMDDNDVEEWLLSEGVEKCPCCEWLVESYQLIPDGDDDPDGHCENCR
jgi:hypothetical protein